MINSQPDYKIDCSFFDGTHTHFRVLEWDFDNWTVHGDYVTKGDLNYLEMIQYALMY